MKFLNPKAAPSWLRFAVLASVMIVFTTVSFAAEVRWIKVGDLHNFYQKIGCEPESDYGNEQQFGLMWPAFYENQDMLAARGFWIAVKDYYDPVVGVQYEYKIAHAGPRPRVEIATSEFMPVEGGFGMIGRFAAPAVVVDGEDASDLVWDDNVDVWDPTLPSDRMIYNRVNTSTGISMDRKIYGYSQDYYDDFFVYEYVFTNTGICNVDGSITHSETLDSVYFHWQYRNALTREGNVEGSGIDWRGRRGWGTPQNCRWGRQTMNDVIGEDPNNPVTSSIYPEMGEMSYDEYDYDGNIMRAFYSWHGRHSDLSTIYDNIGSPNYQGHLPDGMLGASQFTGVVVLHADTSPTDPTDDIYQPTTSQKIESNDAATVNNDQYSSMRMKTEYQSFVSAGHENLSQAEQVVEANVFPNQFSIAGGYSQSWSFGPYTLAPGDSVRIVLAEGAGGLSRERNYEVGNNWYRTYELGESPDLELPDGSLTSDPDEYKNAWVYTGRDSLMETFARARDLYNNQALELGDNRPPEPPASFIIESQGTRILLNWADNATFHPKFEGYRLYRAKGTKYDTYEEIMDCNLTDNNVVQEYSDISAERGQLYFYYIVSYDNGDHPGEFYEGVQLESSPFYTRTNKGATLLRPPADNLDNILVVPNPYNIRNRNQQWVGAENTIQFWNLPEACTIKIFTERGDLIYTHDHAGMGVSTWNLLTSSRQIVVSGVYIATFEAPSGEVVYRKFIIIR
ncbi:MAG: hypothetical protein U9Q77_09870 [Candidatus Marinimicrobia bacterium]|nr:hypothetical protein [Candidatus Neomarinimicrobiota bacterium]